MRCDGGWLLVRHASRHASVTVAHTSCSCSPTASGAARAELVALIRDGTRRYTVPLELTRGRAGWTVTAVGS